MAMVGLVLCISELRDADRRGCTTILAGLGGARVLVCFVPASSFSGVRPGYSYKTGEEGLIGRSILGTRAIVWPWHLLDFQSK